MKDEKLKNGIEEIKQIKMTALEKKQTFERVLNSTLPSVQQPIRSTWFTYSFISRIHKNHLAYYVIIPLLIITSSGVVFASESSLPDSILYPIKVSVVEPIRGALTFSQKNKAHYESSLATERLVEAETLASQGKLDKSTEKKLNDLLDNHTVALNKAVDKINQTGSTDQVDEIVTNFHAGMNAHARVLDIINGEEEDDNISENQDSDVKISETARVNADNLGDKLKNKEKDKKDNKTDKYKKRKDNIELIINRTTTDLDNITTSVSQNRQEIIDNTHETLDEANYLLDEADKKDEEGNSEDAYSTLFDSESAAKEADIFLKAGLGLEEEKDHD